jgi:cytochrome c oxidase subunit II
MRQASNFAEGVDKAFYFIIGIDLFFLIGLSLIIIYFIIKYGRKRNPKPTQIKEKMWLEVLWTVVPLIIVLAMFVVGYMEYSPSIRTPKDAIKITAIGRTWQWTFRYANGKESPELYVPYNKPVELKLVSDDILHSLFIPAFRIKKDVVPGRDDNYMWFIPTIKDTFDIECTAYCGLRHSFMLSRVIVIDEDAYKNWYAKVENKSESGQLPGLALLKNNACLSCHSIDGTKIVGPTFKGFYGSNVEVIEEGKEKTVKADDNYIKAKILGTSKDVVKGYPAGVMRPYKGVLNDEQIKQINEYLKTIGKK